MFERIKNSKTTFEFATMKKLYIEKFHFFESFARFENAKNDVFETIDVNFKSYDFQSTSHISSQFVFNVSTTTSTQDSSIQSTITTLNSFIRSITFVSIVTFEFKCSQRNRTKEIYVLIQKF